MRLEPLFDICLNKHHGTPTSVEANKRASKVKVGYRARITTLMIDREIRGLDTTLEDICKVFGKTPNSLSGRFSELASEGLIRRTGASRNGFSVWVLVR